MTGVALAAMGMPYKDLLGAFGRHYCVAPDGQTIAERPGPAGDMANETADFLEAQRWAIRRFDQARRDVESRLASIQARCEDGVERKQNPAEWSLLRDELDAAVHDLAQFQSDPEVIRLDEERELNGPRQILPSGSVVHLDIDQGERMVDRVRSSTCRIDCRSHHYSVTYQCETGAWLRHSHRDLIYNGREARFAGADRSVVNAAGRFEPGAKTS